MRVLVVEDNPKLSAMVARQLNANRFAADTAADVAGAIECLRLVRYDLVVLDLGLPDADGREVLNALRSSGDYVPVLVATARTEVIHRVDTLDAGADDYLLKPFSVDELLARVRALLRRPPCTLQTVLAAGNVALDTASWALSVGEALVDLPRRETTVLEMLLRGQGRLVTRAALEQAIYPMDAEVTPNAIEAAVSRLRRRLEAHGATVSVVTMRGLGYVLTETP